MEPSFDVPPELVKNEDEFGDGFFRDLRLKEAKAPLVVAGKARNYVFPTLYADVRCAVAIFHCSFKAARDLLAESLGPGALPPRMLGGRSIVAISCYEYRKVRGVRPYNEIAVAVPLRLDGKTGLPVLGAFSGGPDSGYYIASMPVTSEENRLRGHHYWNLPKVTRRIDLEERGEALRIESFGEDGRSLDIGLSVPMAGKAKEFSVQSFLATKKEGFLLRSPTAFEGTFNVNVNAGTLVGGGNKPALELGRGAASDVLRRLGVESTPLQTRYASSMNSYFDLPAGAHKGEA